MKNSSGLPRLQRSLTLDGGVEYEMKHGSLFNGPNIDLKKIRRTISNRLSAQRSRTKMTNYTSDLEKRVNDLEELISDILSPQVESCNEKIKLLRLENDSLRQQLEKRSSESGRQEMAIEEKRAEIEKQKELKRTAEKNKLAADSDSVYRFRNPKC
ncbi:basic leucine zipper 61-like [Dorcoceras hygrometricum]|uniref:Basic leucine zipper 61-like n=1 Tax=Dorcoceras hygrometricum TaxID=472368 RepID=A0A2Z7B2L2_9LAMI|nr:basic leucine zipper 61-like [Dorcoceras hygrometricum]